MNLSNQGYATDGIYREKTVPQNISFLKFSTSIMAQTGNNNSHNVATANKSAIFGIFFDYT